MNHKKDDLRSDTESLLAESVEAEVTDAVWRQFETALEALDGESVDLFRDYLNGNSCSQLAALRGLSPDDVEQWIKKIKRQVIHSLSVTGKVRQ